MKFRIPLLLAAIVAAAACTRDAAQVISGATATAPEYAPSGVPLSGKGFLTGPVAAAARFASAPDLGALVRYPAQRVVRQDGAYTWYRADLSEAYAWAAIASRRLVLTAPSGQLLDFRYERHVQHPNGDWTWIGSIVGDRSQEAIITFGAKAAFGTIGQPGKEPLRLTVRDGVSWLIETDPRKIAGINNVGTKPTKPDFLVAPDIAGAAARRKNTAGMQAAGATQASTSPGPVMAAAGGVPATTVDVVLGYTPGFVTSYGGESQAFTRLNNLVDITNEAYVNSQIDAQIRLVRIVPVNYTDANSNQTALEELTGFVAPSTRTTPSAVFSELRAARDQYGADLVSLVRKFNTPENDGCGIAWLIGGGRSGIDRTDEFFGYSVVSDGRDAGTDGKTYFCRDETLAHELGHNMGAQHDRDTADGADNILQNNEYGVFDYSFGYKTGVATGNFYTIMAYGDSGQTRYRVFSNPQITTCGGLACGIANQADNARSLRQTTPTVAAFRASVVKDAAPVSKPAVPNDMDADGKSDMLWYSGATLAWWRMSGESLSSSGGQAVPQGYMLLATADFDADKRVDVLWQTQDAQLVMWRANGDGFVSTTLGAYPAGWSLAAAVDVNGDGAADIVWRNGVSVGWWLMQGPVIAGSGIRSVMPNSDVLAAADFNGDGKGDLVWQSESGSVSMWISTGTDFSVSSVADYPRGWTFVGAGDLDADGKADLFWSNATALGWWRMNGAVIVGSGNQSLGIWSGRVALGDLDGDGRTDMVWTSRTHAMSYWRGTGGDAFSVTAMPDYPAQWTAVRSGARASYTVTPSDRDFDGRSDIMWHNGATLAWWHLRDSLIVATGTQGMGAGSSVLGLGNFDGDGRADLFWRDSSNRLQLWSASGSGFVATEVGGAPAGWTHAGQGDVDGDGRTDVLWHNGSALGWWNMDMATIRSSGLQSMGVGSTVLGVGDTDGDGRDDVVWRDASDTVHVWLARGNAFVSAPVAGFPAGWTVVGMADVNGDQREDVLWHNGTTLAWWHMRGASIVSSGSQSMGSGSSVLGAFDFNGDDRMDVAWRDAAGGTILWSASGTGFVQAPVDGDTAGWSAVRP